MKMLLKVQQKKSILNVSPSGKSYDDANAVKMYTINLDSRNLTAPEGTWGYI